MIPLEKLIPIEQKAREYGYITQIIDGGRRISFSKYIVGDASHTIVYNAKDGFSISSPSTYEKTIEDYENLLSERSKVLELAKMLRDASKDDTVCVIGPVLIENVKVGYRVGVVENYKIEPIGEIKNVKGDLIYVQTYGENPFVWVKKSDVVGIPIEIGDLDYNENKIAMIISEIGLKFGDNDE
jgi:hypothetical protein